jgi:hypothetical protein
MRHLTVALAIAWLPISVNGADAVTSMAAIPPDVMNALVDLCRPCSFADFNAPWNATDVISDDLPRRRLVRVEHSDSEWHIEYEHGGRGRHTHAVTFGVYPKLHFVRGSSCEPAKERRCEW